VRLPSPDPAGNFARTLFFGRRVLHEFLANRGVLLAGGVGYNLLLSIVPLFIVSGVVLSSFVSEARLLATLESQLGLLAPGHAAAVMDVVVPVLRSPEGIGLLGFLVLMFFASLAFRMLEDAIAIIFGSHRAPLRRSAWFSTLAPYVFVVVFGAGLLLLSLLVSIVNAFAGQAVPVQGGEASPATFSRFLVYTLGFLGLALLFTVLYKLLPVVHIAPSRAVIGGFIAAALWQGVLQVLVWYVEDVSMVTTVYGPFATVVVLLLGLEVGAGILLLGAQVIAELERSARAGVPWYEAPANRDLRQRAQP